MADKQILNTATDLIMKWEGFKSKPYLCPSKVWTVGYGRTEGVNESTEEVTKEGEKKWVEDRVFSDLQWLRKEALPTTWLRTSQWAALCSLVYNIGRGAFKSSTLCRLLSQDKEPIKKDVTSAWVAWKFSKGVVLKGLLDRRKEEVALFFSEI